MPFSPFIQLSSLLLFYSFLLTSWQCIGTTIPEIAYQSFTLENGLRVIVHEDRKSPVVSVHVWYHVGSKDETQGKTGFAHLFEHIMLSGSENHNYGYFDTIDKLGATEANGTTYMDRTQYFQNVPTGALDTTLWLESDRMGHLLGVLDIEKLNKIREVVKNEKRQGENKPYGKANQQILKNIYPQDHPYSWPVIGSMTDLNNATLTDARNWFSKYYGAKNAILVLSGDIDLPTAKQKAQHYFSDIPAGPPLIKKKTNIAKRNQSSHQLMYDHVPQPRLYTVWNVAQLGSTDATILELNADILGSGKHSRLYKRLVETENLATNAYVSLWQSEISSMFRIVIDIKNEDDIEKVKIIVKEELVNYINFGPSVKELKLAKAVKSAHFLRKLERIGGKSGKAAILAKGALLLDDPNALIKAENMYQNTTAIQAQKAAKKWLSQGEFNLDVRPFGQLRTVKSSVDRSQLPAVKKTPALNFPELEKFTLNNGLKVVLASRHTAPLVQFLMQFDAGIAADQFHQPGIASFALDMLTKGTRDFSKTTINEKKSLLGAQITHWTTLDSSIIKLDALKQNMTGSLALFSNILQNADYQQQELEQFKVSRVAKINLEKSNPYKMALRTLPPLLYGQHHPYGVPLTGTGNKKSILDITQNKLRHFKQQWFRPDNGTLIVTGDINKNELEALLNHYLAEWEKPATTLLKKPLPHVNLPGKSVVYLIDQPNAVQTTIIAGQLIPSVLDEHDLSFKIANTILGSDYISRINMNLREDKAWSYGAYTKVKEAKGQQAFFAYAPVQIDKTKAAILELKKELKQFVNLKPATQHELDEIVNMKGSALPARYETNNKVVSEIANMQTFGRPDSYIQDYKTSLSQLTLKEINTVAHKNLKPDQLTWVIIGDLNKIAAEVNSLDLGEVNYLH